MMLTGCCTSRQRAAEVNAALRLQNIARAEPIMRRAATQREAELLPGLPEGLGFTPWCAALGGHPPPNHLCVLEAEGDAYRLVDHEGNRRVAIPIGWNSSTTRLARRGRTFFLLTPKVTAHKKDKRVQCECDGGPVIVSMSGYVHLGFAFVVDDQPEIETQQVTVPVVEDYIEWECKAVLV